MPDYVAHHQFGQDMIRFLDADLTSCVLAYKREYDIGLQGPDIFFFYKPYRKTDIADYGHILHSLPAIEMFSPILAKVQERAALSYMAGLICHYMLDACCHPYVNGQSRDLADHTRIEAAYDRHILSRYGYAKPRCKLVHTSRLDFDALASLWKGVNADIIKKCIRSRHFCTWLLDHRKLLVMIETVAARRGAFSPMCLPKDVPQEQQAHIKNLDTLYQKALEKTPPVISRAVTAMGTAPRYLAGFEMNYEGVIAHEQD